ncbi:MAG TPA: hypothetical protein VE244_11455 [Nitrososphaeraceae archaeon]|jgi:hypothetical protein|nr:hypothetical protein [Nitrososphaeraceae archaeon]
MRLTGLLGFITVMWVMILAITAFLLNFVAPIDFVLFRNGLDRLIVSLTQASIAIIIVMILVWGLNKMKEIYMQKKLQL